MLIVINIALYTLKFFKWVDLILGALMQKKKKREERENILGGYEWIHSIDSDDRFTGIDLSSSTSSCIY